MSESYEGGFASVGSAEPPDDEEFRGTAEFAATPAAPVGFWAKFRAWRRSRPFWGALFAFISGAEILFLEAAPFRVVLHIGPAGLIGFAVPILMMLSAIMLWFVPQPVPFYASLILLLSLASWITSNLGGFILGMLLGLVGGALALTWTNKPKTDSKNSSKHLQAAGEEETA